MVKPKVHIVLATTLLLLVSGVAAQSSDAETQQEVETAESELGQDVIAHNFVMRGLPASNQEEVEVERSFETEPDSDESFSITEDEATEIALDELGSSEWNLEETEADDGLYEFEFVRGESQAEVSVDGSSGRIVEFEAEVEWEPENDEPSAVLSGFVQFSKEGYEVDVDIDVNEESNEALFEVEIEHDNEEGAEVVTRKGFREFEDAAPGEYNGQLEVTRDDEVVYTDEQQFIVPDPVQESEESVESLEDWSREELIEEIRSLREQVQTLQESDSSESSEEPSETPENSDQRPGFVNNLLSGIFG